MKESLESLRDIIYESLKTAYNFQYGKPDDDRKLSITEHLTNLKQFLTDRSDELTKDDKGILEKYYNPKAAEAFNFFFAQYLFNINEEAKEISDNLDRKNSHIIDKLKVLGNQLALDKFIEEKTKSTLSEVISTTPSST